MAQPQSEYPFRSTGGQKFGFSKSSNSGSATAKNADHDFRFVLLFMSHVGSIFCKLASANIKLHFPSFSQHRF